MIYCVSDDVVLQYKIRKIIFNHYSLKDDFGMYVEWHFFGV
jgi:hypothetical protein